MGWEHGPPNLIYFSSLGVGESKIKCVMYSMGTKSKTFAECTRVWNKVDNFCWDLKRKA